MAKFSKTSNFKRYNSSKSTNLNLKFLPIDKNFLIFSQYARWLNFFFDITWKNCNWKNHKISNVVWFICKLPRRSIFKSTKYLHRKNYICIFCIFLIYFFKKICKILKKTQHFPKIYNFFTKLISIVEIDFPAFEIKFENHFKFNLINESHVNLQIFTWGRVVYESDSPFKAVAIAPDLHTTFLLLSEKDFLKNFQNVDKKSWFVFSDPVGKWRP